MKNIGEACRATEERQAKKAMRDIKPFLDKAFDVVMRIPEKRRYARWTQEEWDQSLANRVRLSILGDPDWRAFRAKRGTFLLLLRSHVQGALQAGYIACHDQIEENIEKTRGVDIDWPTSRKRLVNVGTKPVNGFTAREHGKAIWEAMEKRIDSELRNACRRTSSLSGATMALRKACAGASETAMSSIESLMGDAVCDGQREALRDLEGVQFVAAR